MSPGPVSYEEVLSRLREAEDVIRALLSSQADAVVTARGVHLLRLHETDRALHLAKASLEQLLEDRTRSLNQSNQKLVQEIEERKRAEAAFSASEEKFRALLESASEGVVVVDSSGRIVLVNRSTEMMFGYGRRQLTGTWFDSLVPGVLKGVNQADGSSGAGGHGLEATRLERTVHRQDGTEFPVLVSISLTDGRKPLALVLVTDMSEHKRMEANLREAQKMESLGLLAGGVAHDFNNLLTAILGNASLLMDVVPAHGSPYLKAVISGAETAGRITRQLLAYAGKGQFRISDVDLTALVQDSAELLRSSIPKGVEFRLELNPEVPLIQADAGQIQQILMNLVINAGEAIGDANGTIGIATGEENRCDQPSAPGVLNKYAFLKVSDDGCGMDQRTKARIFDPFYTTKVYGRGLGLSAVRGIVRACGGTVEVDSEPGIGTTFKVVFPALESMRRYVLPEIEARSSRKRGTILIVDDEDGVRAFAAAALQLAGFGVLQARHGQEAVDLVRSDREIDLVLLDVTMPVMGGREALEQIKKLRPKLSVIVSSGYGSEEAQRLMAVSGKQVGFIAKPYTAQQLVRYIDSNRV